MSAKRSAQLKRLQQKRFENVCNRCGRTNLWWHSNPKINDWKWYLTGAGDEGLPHECKKAGA